MMSIVGVACGKAGPKHHPLGWTIEVTNATLFFCEKLTTLDVHHLLINRKTNIELLVVKKVLHGEHYVETNGKPFS
jgi:hypothetical protein